MPSEWSTLTQISKHSFLPLTYAAAHSHAKRFISAGLAAPFLDPALKIVNRKKEK